MVYKIRQSPVNILNQFFYQSAITETICTCIHIAIRQFFYAKECYEKEHLINYITMPITN